MTNRKRKDKTYIIATGRISGTYADRFHRVSEYGKVGYNLDRDPTDDEKKEMLADIVRHREQLVHELTELAIAERVLRGIK